MIGSMPILYSFRRCPYAMRARLAISASGQQVELREVVLRDKPASMLVASPKGTVPVLVIPKGKVIDESLNIMAWAMSVNDREGWMDIAGHEAEAMGALVAENDGPFKQALDRYKYPNRYDGADAEEARERGSAFIEKLEARLEDQAYLFGERFTFADAAILPFMRQFAHVDRDWFFGQDWPNVQRWLNGFLESERFKAIMGKYPQWAEGEPGVEFGNASAAV